MSNLRESIEKALSEIVEPNSYFPFSMGKIEPGIRSLDERKKTVTIDIGECRYVEGCSISGTIERGLKEKVPELTHVSICMQEL